MISSQVIRRSFTKFGKKEYATDQTTVRKGIHNVRNENWKIKMAFKVSYSQNLSTENHRHSLCQYRYFSQITCDIFSDSSKERFIKSVQTMKIMPFRHSKYTVDASVMVPLCKVNGKPSVLFTMRSATVSRNKGDASFPGGMKEVSDKNAIDVAIRETQEEIGPCSNIDVWTLLPPMPSRSGNIKVIPVVAFLGDVNLKEYSANKNEVDYIFTLTIDSLCDQNNWYFTQYKIGYRMPVYIVGKYRVWGLTAAILHYTLKILVPNNFTQDLPWGCDKLQINKT